MDEIEAKLGSILGNPDMMAQIISMAQKMGGSPDHTPTAPPEPVSVPSISGLPEGLDMSMIAKIAGIAGSTGVDKNQQTLLLALKPYLSTDRISKLEKAMRAAKLAGVTTSLLGSGILSQLGR